MEEVRGAMDEGTIAEWTICFVEGKQWTNERLQNGRLAWLRGSGLEAPKGIPSTLHIVLLEFWEAGGGDGLAVALELFVGGAEGDCLGEVWEFVAEDFFGF